MFWLLLIELTARAQDAPVLQSALPPWAVVLVSLLGGGTLTELARYYRSSSTPDPGPTAAEQQLSEQLATLQARAELAEQQLAEQQLATEENARLSALVEQVTGRVFEQVNDHVNAQLTEQLSHRNAVRADESEERASLIAALVRVTAALEALRAADRAAG